MPKKEEEIDVFALDEKSKEAKKKSEHQHKRRISDLKELLRYPAGRRFIWEELSRTGVFRSSFSLNSMQTAFQEGQRDIGLSLLRDINEAEPTAFARMQQEYISELKSQKKEEVTEDGE